MQKRIRVKNTYDYAIGRGGIVFPANEEKTVSVGNAQYREIKACRYLQCLDADKPVATKVEPESAAVPPEPVTKLEAGEDTSETSAEFQADAASGDDAVAPAAEGEACPHCGEVMANKAGVRRHITVKHPEHA